MIRKFVNLTISTVIFGSFGYGYLSYKVRNNKQQYEKLQNADTLKDASRLSNDSFGISWGFQADDIIMKRLDSGDMLFIKWDCSECLEITQLLTCYYDGFTRLDVEYDAVAWVFRDSEGVKVLFNQFGETKWVEYAELVSLPFLLTLTCQKGDEKGRPIVHHKLKEIYTDNIKQEKQLTFINKMANYLYGQTAYMHSINQLMTSDEQINIRSTSNKMLSSL